MNTESNTPGVNKPLTNRERAIINFVIASFNLMVVILYIITVAITHEKTSYPAQIAILNAIFSAGGYIMAGVLYGESKSE